MADNEITPEEHVLLSISQLLNHVKSLEHDFEGCTTDKEKHMLMKVTGIGNSMIDMEKILEKSFDTNRDKIKAKIKRLKES